MRRILALLAVLSIVFASAALIGPALVSADAPGNNGTLKVHEFGTPSGTESNDPKVCNFNFEGFGFDHGQSGYIVIEGQGQTSGTFDLVDFGPTNADGYADTDYQTLPDGHYKATLYGKDTGQTGVDLADEKAKSKVFKVDCVTDTEPEPTPTPTPTPDDGGDDDAALNIRKVDEEGKRLEGAVFTVDGLEGTFTTGRNGQFCITGLPADSEYVVTEIEAPEGYEISDEPSQMVEVDDDGSGLCASPDAVFVNTLAEEETPAPTPTPVVNPTPTPDDGEEVGSPTPTPSARAGEQGGNPTPRGGVQGGVPDTAMQPASDASFPIAPIMLLTASLVSLGYVKVHGARARDIR